MNLVIVSLLSQLSLFPFMLENKKKLSFLLAEFMPGGSLYEYLHRNHTTMELSQLVKFAIDVCSGMEYLHQNDIIHRDLKTANLLMDAESVCIHATLFSLF